MTERVQAAGGLRRLGPLLPDDELPVPGGHRARARASSSSRGSSTRARSRCTGASTAARRWPKPRSSTRITRRRRSTSSSRWRPTSAAELAARVPALAGRNVSVLIWTTTPWTIPSNLAIAFHPEFDYAAYDVDGRAVIVAEGARANASRQAVGRAVRRAGRADEGRAARSASASSIRSTTRDSLGVLGDYVTLDAGHRRGAHRAGPRRRRLPHRHEVRPRDLRADRAGRTLPRHGGAVRRPAGVRRQPERRGGARRSAAGCGTARRSRISTRTAGAATTR